MGTQASNPAGRFMARFMAARAAKARPGTDHASAKNRTIGKPPHRYNALAHGAYKRSKMGGAGGGWGASDHGAVARCSMRRHAP